MVDFDPVFCGSAVGDPVGPDPVLVETESLILLPGTAVFEGGVLAVDDEGNAQFDGQPERNGEDGHVHGDRRRTAVHQGTIGELPFHLGVDGIVDVIDAEADEVLEILSTEFGTTRRTPRHCEHVEPHLRQRATVRPEIQNLRR